DSVVNNINVDFSLGGHISCSTYDWRPPSFPCANISGSVQGGLGPVYLIGNDVVLVLAEVGGIISALLWIGNTGLNLGRRQLQVILVLLLGAVIAGGVLLGGTALAGPGPQASAYCYQYSGEAT